MKYAIPSDTVDNQFYATPKVYKYDKKILKQSKLKEDKRPKNIPADIKRVSEANELEVMLKPGEAVHVGFYLSFQPTHEIISQNGLKVLIRNDSVLTPTHIDKRMKHWRNIRTDLLEIK